MRRHPELLDTLFANVREQAARRKQSDTSDKVAVLRQALQPHQLRLEQDRSRWVSVISPRQTGKSTGVMLIVSIRCEEKGASEWVVIGLTRPSVKRIYWGPLKLLSESFELGIKFQEQELIATFPNGSKIYFVSGDTTAEIEKLRGGRYDGAVVDEGASYPAPLFQDMVDVILQPALNTKRGPLFVIGTPGDVLDGPFYLATCTPPVQFKTPKGPRLSNRAAGTTGEFPAKWSLHVWTLRDNQKCPWLWTEALALLEHNGWSESHPVFQREYLGRWVATNNRLVYRYQSHRHDYLPEGEGRFGLSEEHDWSTVLGVDLGTRDGTAFVVWAHSKTCPDLFEVYSGKRRADRDERLPLGDIVQWYRDVDAEFGPFDAVVADPASLATMVIDTLAVEHGIYLEPAEKREKADHIEIFNSDLDAKRIHVRSHGALAEELATNRWDEKKLMSTGKKEEDRNTPNDVADAGLYAFRWCNHRRAVAPVRAPSVGSRDWWMQRQAEELEAAKAAVRRRNDPDAGYLNLDREWWHDAS